MVIRFINNPFRRFIGIIPVILGVLVAIFYFVSLRSTDAYSKTVVLLSDPVLVVSRSPFSRMATVVSIPQSLLFDGVRGYGRYSLAALVKLGVIDGLGGSPVKETVSEALATPIVGYVSLSGETQKVSDGEKNQVQKIREIFCGLPCIVRFVSGQTYTSDLSLVEYLRLSFLFRTISESDVVFIDPVKKNSVTEITDTDGITEPMFDAKKFDTYLPNVFEEFSVRREALRIRVINATTQTGLAERFSRKLSRVGALPVTVESAIDRKLQHCDLNGSKKAMTSETARYLKKVYGCTESEKKVADALVDLTVRVGTMYEKMYLPLREVPRLNPRQ